MYLDIKKIKKLLAADKRKCDRLNIAAKISYKGPLATEWTWPLDAQNIGGGGVQFISSKPLTKSRRLKLKILFPDYDKPLEINAMVVWCRRSRSKLKKKKPRPRKQLPVYVVGVKFTESNYKDRHYFVSYLSEKLFTEYLKASK